MFPGESSRQNVSNETQPAIADVAGLNPHSTFMFFTQQKTSSPARGSEELGGFLKYVPASEILVGCLVKPRGLLPDQEIFRLAKICQLPCHTRNVTIRRYHTCSPLGGVMVPTATTASSAYSICMLILSTRLLIYIFSHRRQ